MYIYRNIYFLTFHNTRTYLQIIHIEVRRFVSQLEVKFESSKVIFNIILYGIYYYYTRIYFYFFLY